ncbi:MAG: GNAT family N-acetyltransferase [Acidobacteriota bacterium]
MTIKTATFETDRLRFRPYSRPDQDAFVQLMGDPDVMEHVAGGRLESAEAIELFGKALQACEEERMAVWAVECLESGDFLGHAELKPSQQDDGLEIVYLLAKTAWGRGLGTEVARAVQEHAHQTLDCDRVVATTAPDNRASERILERLGFEFVREWMEPDDDVMTRLWVSGSRRKTATPSD